MTMTTALFILAVGIVVGHTLHKPLARARALYQRHIFKPALVKRYNPGIEASMHGRDN